MCILRHIIWMSGMGGVGAALALIVATSACSRDGKGDPSEPASQDPATAEVSPGPATETDTAGRPTLERKEPLPELARSLLRKYMVEHGDSMESLLWSALMLEHEMTEVVVEQILGQPRLSRPIKTAPGPQGGDTARVADTLNDWLPVAFYDLQDQMFSAAEELRLEARRRNDVGTAKAYARLTETCVTCHSLYLSLPGQSRAK